MSLLSQKIADAISAETGPGVLAVDDGAYQLTLQLRASNPDIGTSFHELTFGPVNPGHKTLDSLKSWADALVARITYLGEPLAVQEVDTVCEQVQIRSEKPSERIDKLTYYELLINAQGNANLRRFVFDKKTRQRETVPCSLNCETLERLAEDLVRTAG